MNRNNFFTTLLTLTALAFVPACGSTKAGAGISARSQQSAEDNQADSSTGSTCGGPTLGGATTSGTTGGSGSSSSTTSGAATAGDSQSPVATVADPQQPGGANADLSWTDLPNTELYPSAGPGQQEILQGAANDCTMFAALGSIVAQNPQFIKNMIVLAGRTKGGTDVYTVNLFNSTSGKPVSITVDSEVLVGKDLSMPYDPTFVDPVSKKIVLWPHIVQKAFAVYYGSYGNIAESASANIPILTGVQASRLFAAIASKEKFSAALSSVVGKGFVVTADSSLSSTQPADLSNTVIVQNGEYKCATEDGEMYCLADAHEYEVLAFDGVTVTLRNPWGTNIGSGVSANGIVSLPIDAYDALIPATWAEETATVASK